jgi:hypothetical protein
MRINFEKSGRNNSTGFPCQDICFTYEETLEAGQNKHSMPVEMLTKKGEIFNIAPSDFI